MSLSLPFQFFLYLHCLLLYMLVLQPSLLSAVPLQRADSIFLAAAVAAAAAAAAACK